jgi:predicted Zn-dependent protease with MMP-like domain
MAENAPDLARLTQWAADTVGAAQRQLPRELRTLARDVPVHYEARPADDVLAEGFEPDILGLFSGNPHGTELAHDHPAPPQICLYLESLWDFATGDPDIFRDEVRLTYLHELGHYFGWDEDELAARGLD